MKEQTRGYVCHTGSVQLYDLAFYRFSTIAVAVIFALITED